MTPIGWGDELIRRERLAARRRRARTYSEIATTARPGQAALHLACDPQKGLVAPNVAQRARPLLAVGLGVLGAGAGLRELAVELLAVEVLGRDGLLDEQQRAVGGELHVALRLGEAHDVLLGAIEAKLRR